MPEATFTFRVDEQLKAKFSDAARAHDRTSAQLLRDFMRGYVAQQEEGSAYDAGTKSHMQTGLDAANAADLTSATEIKAEVWRRESPRRIAGGS